MSEFQYVAFRAVDGPVSDENLKFMRRQSTRAEITPWSFDNEYHFGDFHGDAVEMLRRGYDLHLHYANFGTRKLLIRLPQGIAEYKAVEPYLGETSLSFLPDKRGPGGILAIEACFEPGDLEEFWEFDALLDHLALMRAEILQGDLRPLYLAHLAIACDSNHDPEETKEGPVPAGLEVPTESQSALAEFLGISKSLFAAAAQESPQLPARSDLENQYGTWLQNQLQSTKDCWLAQLMGDPRAHVRREILAAFQKTQTSPVWPTVKRGRTVAALTAAASDLRGAASRRDAAVTAVAKVKRLAEMAADPTPTLRETVKLVARRGQEAYRRAAALLVELREALAGSDQSGLAEQQAQELKKQNPTLRMLVSELRRKGFIPK